MNLVLRTPTRLYLENFDENDIIKLKGYLSYNNKSMQYQVEKFINNRWYVKQYGYEAFMKKLNAMRNQIKSCLIMQDEKSDYYTYPGLKDLVLQYYPKAEYINKVFYPEYNGIPFETLMPNLRPYQQESVDVLIANKHASISLRNGTWKIVYIT